MKKLLVFMLVLGLASWAWAVPYFEISGPLPIKDSYKPSDLIEINLMDDGLVTGFVFDAVVDVICPNGGGAGGYSDEPQVFNPGFGTQHAGALNVNRHLVEYCWGYVTSTPKVPVSGKLYSFMYHVPDVPASTLICIESFADGDMYWQPVINYIGGSYYEGPIEMDECIHVVPEPATIALLGLGGLLLRRRK